jgi:Ca2+-transporting ATPase
LCNDAQLQAAPEREPAWTPLGDPTEVALVTLAIKAGCDPQALRARSARQAELPFDSVEKLMATQHAGPHGPRVFIKGAPEVLLDAKSASATLATVERWTARALRVLAVGVVDGLELDPGAGFAALRGRIQWLGLIGQIDPPRAEVKAAVERCWQAGIRPVVVTGDHKATGWAVAKELGIARDGDAVLEGRELAQLTDAQLAQQIDRIAVFARVQPAQKLRIVAAYQQRGHVVAMTGDGVNDAPALVEADVGVAMGMGGSEVAKEAANIVITDDNFATIMAAVEEGRIVYRNMTKAVLFLFSTSLAEVGILLACLVMGYAPPFVAVQILWNNLVTEGLVTVNLVMEPAEGDEMTRPPIAPDMPLLSRALLTRAALMVATIVITTLVWFVLRSAAGVPPAQVRTETFTLLVLCEWFNVLNCRSEWRSALNLDLFRNRWLITGLVVGNLLQVAVVFWRPFGGVFHTVPIPFVQIVALGAAASAVLWVEEIRKLWVAAPRLKRSGREVRWRRATRVP